MRNWLQKHQRSPLFIAGGAAAGFLHYTFRGCTSGCAITANPLRTMAYMGLAGWLVSCITEAAKEL